MKKYDYHPLIGYRRDVALLTSLGIVNNSAFFNNKKRVFEEKIANARDEKEIKLYKKKIEDIDIGVLDAINIRRDGCFYPKTIAHVCPHFFIRHSLRYRQFNREFYAEFTRNADASLGRNNANLYMIQNRCGIEMMRDLAFRDNPPTELEMYLNGFLRTPAYKQKYSVLVMEMNDIMNDLTTRPLTPELAADVKYRTERCKQQAKALNKDQQYILRVEDRFKTHYAQCGPGVAELAIAEVLKCRRSD
jgi:hypothetical protein